MKTQKYIRKIPDTIMARIELSQSPTIRVGRRYVFGSPEFEAVKNRFKLNIQDLIVDCPDPMPSRANGPWSRKNADGWTEVHRDQPKETYSYYITTPNFGDPTKGYHDIYIEKMRYPRTHHGAKMLAFQFQLVDEDGQRVLECSLDKHLEVDSPSFRDDLFYQLNVFCENCGNLDVLIEDEPRQVHVQRINWEIFQSMPLEDLQVHLIRGVRDPERQEQIKEVVAARYRFFRSLSPSRYIVGADAFTQYFGAVFNERAVLFECVNYGNAIYLLGEDWEQLTQLSRTQLLTTPGLRFERIVHRGRWMDKARLELLRRLRETREDGTEEPPAVAV